MRAVDPNVRPMLAADVEPVVEVTAAAFGRDLGDVAVGRRWRERIAHPWRTDPDGAFVAESDGRVIGVAEAIVRERLWCLSMLAVEPGIQSGGAGRALLERALTYGRATEAGLLVSSNDPRALRLYRDSGFALHPTFEAEGIVDRRRLPRQDGAVRDDDGTDLEALARLTRCCAARSRSPTVRPGCAGSPAPSNGRSMWWLGPGCGWSPTAPCACAAARAR